MKVTLESPRTCIHQLVGAVGDEEELLVVGLEVVEVGHEIAVGLQEVLGLLGHQGVEQGVGAVDAGL